MNSHLRVTMVQCDLAWQEPATNRHRLAAHFRGLAGHTDLVVLPEMFSTGFSMEAAALAEDMDGPTVGWMREEAVAMGCVLAGSLIVREGGRHFNRLVWARPDGTLAHYDKRHLFRMAGEDQRYLPGQDRVIVAWRDWRINLQVCYDLRFPVFSRNREDYDLLLYVANWPQQRRYHWRQLLIARAIENLACVVGVNRIGADARGLSYSGDSLAIAADGNILLDALSENGAFQVILDSNELRTYRKEFPANLDADRFQLE